MYKLHDILYNPNSSGSIHKGNDKNDIVHSRLKIDYKN